MLQSIQCFPINVISRKLCHRLTKWFSLEKSSRSYLVQVLCPNKDIQRRVSNTHVQAAFENLQGGRSTTSLGNVCQRSITHTAQKCCLMFRWNLVCSISCPLPPVLVLGTTKKSLLHLLWTIPSVIYRHWYVPPMILFFSKLNSLLSLSLSS